MAIKLVEIYYSSFWEKLPEKVFEKYLSLLLEDQIIRNQRLIRWQDRHLHLFGKLLLFEGLKKFGHYQGEEYYTNGRPFLKNSDIDFNISHSGNYAICAISDKTKVGIDIQEIKPIEFKDFKRVFSKQEWGVIRNSSNPLFKFYNFWTRKESVIKADGRGLKIPLDIIDVVNDSVTYDNQEWFLTELEIDEKYCACLATNIKDICVEMRKVF